MASVVYTLHATTIVGCSISLFFSILALVALVCFRPRTEAHSVKKNLTVSLCLTQLVLLTGIFGYGTEVGCRALSCLLHFAGSACFVWCAIDALSLYFFHINSFHPVRHVHFYLILGWGIPTMVLTITILVGFLGNRGRHFLTVYTCWTSDHVMWAFVVPSITLATVNIGILCTILRKLRQPSYDVCPKSVMEKRGTRYGLRTNSLMLLGLTLGWVFAMLSFKDGENARYQLTFGLVQGLQGIFLFFFHCVLNSDHVKSSGYSSAGKQKEEKTIDQARGRKIEPQTSARRKPGGRKPLIENVPLISIASSSKTDDGRSTDSAGTKDSQITPTADPLQVNLTTHPVKPREVTPVRTLPEYAGMIPQLPGTPEESTRPPETARREERTSMPVDLGERQSAMNMTKAHRLSTNGTISKSSTGERNNRLEPTDRHQFTSNEHRSKSISDPTIPDSGNAQESHKQKRKSSGETSDRLRTHSTDRKRTNHGSSLNELESLFSNTEFPRAQRSSVSSLRERRASRETEKRLSKGSSIESHEPDTQGGHLEVEQPKASPEKPDQTIS
ncbi:cadherin EGF LAG seven-pass G-type receptor 1 isoform X2 [Nematostella vectensis]|uniref:cadherin EGF LAG seven-pass G-type receptor 1 isoform X2 n=1 Tax=Nematostella vectensis TaxID=45351 RepID=UPI0020777F18|nr:cadherin EGF LAG seven-pass G-type receptor 1 isoform X2 [Nematostella vectensis]